MLIIMLKKILASLKRTWGIKRLYKKIINRSSYFKNYYSISKFSLTILPTCTSLKIIMITTTKQIFDFPEISYRHWYNNYNDFSNRMLTFRPESRNNRSLNSLDKSQVSNIRWINYCNQKINTIFETMV